MESRSTGSKAMEPPSITGGQERSLHEEEEEEAPRAASKSVEAPQKKRSANEAEIRTPAKQEARKTSSRLAMLQEAEQEAYRLVEVATQELEELQSQLDVDPKVLKAAVFKKKKAEMVYANAAFKTNDAFHEEEASGPGMLHEPDEAEPYTSPSLTDQLSKYEEEERLALELVHKICHQVWALGKSSPMDPKALRVALQNKKIADTHYAEAASRADSIRNMLAHPEGLEEEKSAIESPEKKQSHCNKVKISLEIKPVDASIDLEALAQAIQEISHEGIHGWGSSYRVVPYGFGLDKLVITAVAITSILDADGVCDELSFAFPGDIQSIDIVQQSPILDDETI